MEQRIKNIMRHVTGKATAYTVYAKGKRPKTYMDRSLSAVVTQLLNDNSMVPVAVSQVTHTDMVEIISPASYADVRVTDEETGAEAKLGDLVPADGRLAHCIVTQSVSGWHAPDQYEAMRRRLSGDYAAPVGAEEVLVGPREGGVDLPSHVKQPPVNYL